MAARVVHCGDGVAFLANALPADHAIVTSLPDHSEVPALGVDGWKRWFAVWPPLTIASTPLVPPREPSVPSQARNESAAVSSKNGFGKNRTRSPP